MRARAAGRRRSAARKIVLMLVSEPEELRDVRSAGRERARGELRAAGERREDGIVHSEQVSLQALLREELVRERTGRPPRGASRLRMLTLPVAEHGIREAAEGVGRPRALIGGRARRPRASTDEVPQRRHHYDRPDVPARPSRARI